jgi:hypothetical protein
MGLGYSKIPAEFLRRLLRIGVNDGYEWISISLHERLLKKRMAPQVGTRERIADHNDLVADLKRLASLLPKVLK